MFEKESGDYLAQISNNAEEKTAFLSHALEDATLPKVGEKVRIMELGTGGGESLRALQKVIEGHEDVEIIAAEIMPKLASSLKRETGVEIIASDAAHIALKGNSVSAINASAVLHEVYSYGTRTTEESRFGEEAVVQSLGEIHRVLTPDGMLAYRDVLAVEGDPQEAKTVTYNHPAWAEFHKMFTANFLSSKVSPYDKDTVRSSQDKDGKLTLAAPRGFQREFQRHYLMFRDYMRNAIGRSIGVSIANTGWIDKDQGLKSFSFYVDPEIEPMLADYEMERHNSAGGVLYRMNSDQFDNFYDDVMFHVMKKIQDGLPESQQIKEKLDRWVEREGQEYYTYANSSRFIGLAAQASYSQDGSSVLLPESLDHIEVVPRYYYNRYLESAADNPERDGKQIMALRKMPIEKARSHISLLRERNRIEQVVAEPILEEIERLMSRA